jgi:hypothetical protein
MFPISLPWPDSQLLLTLPFAGLPLWVRGLILFFLVVIPIALVLFLYRYELRLVSHLTASFLLTLRLLVLALLLGLLGLQPVYAADQVRPLPGRVLIAVDRSASMDFADPQMPAGDKLRLARVLGLHKNTLPNIDAWLTRWIADHDLRRDPSFVDQAEPSDGRKRQLVHDSLLSAIDGLSRGAIARKLLESGLLTTRHEVELIGFHQHLLDAQLDDLDALFAQPAPTPDSPRLFTDLKVPLVTVLERSSTSTSKAPILGVIVLSDGQHNFGSSAFETANQLGQRKIPIFPVALGSTKWPPDLAIVSVRGPDSAIFKGVEVNVEVGVKIGGMKPGEYVLELHREGEMNPLASRILTHDGQDRLLTETFAQQFDKAGPQTLTATIRPKEQGKPPEKEITLQNNRLSTTLSVADDRAKVLLVDGEPRWEYHYLSTALSRDRLIDLDRILFDPPRLDESLSTEQTKALGLAARSWPEKLDALEAYQCILLGDIDPTKVSAEVRRRLELWVSDTGGTLILCAGKKHPPTSWPARTATGEEDPLQRLLPIEAPQILAPPAGLPLTLTRAGRDMAFMQLDTERDDNDTLWAGFPRPWPWAVGGRAKPAATSLASWLDPALANRPSHEQERANAIVARHNYGFGRVLYVGLDSTWRWRFRVGDLYHHRFWGQVLRWAASDRPLVVGNSAVRFGTTQATYRAGETIEVIARATSADPSPTGNDSSSQFPANLAAGVRFTRVTDQQQTLIPLERRVGQQRVIEGKWRDVPAGEYLAELVIPEWSEKLKDQAGNPLRAKIQVLASASQELHHLEMNRATLEELAKASGGKVWLPHEIEQLSETLQGQSVTEVQHVTLRLYQWPMLLPILAVLLGIEWMVRKWHALA